MITTSSENLLRVAVPELQQYDPHTGIGRLFNGIAEELCNNVVFLNTSYTSYNLPLLRNYQFGISQLPKRDAILLPKMTGARSLRYEHESPSIVIAHDIGFIDCLQDRLSLDSITYHNLKSNFKSLSYASRIISVSNFTRDRILHFMPKLEGKISVISSLVDPIFLNHRGSQLESRSVVEETTGYKLREPLLLYVGTELPRKNIQLLIHTYKLIKQKYPQAQLLKVGAHGGKIWRKETLRIIRSAGLIIGTDVLLIDQLDDNLLASCYKAADLFLSASLYEGFGLPALEAMAIGTSVVVTNCGSFPEIVGDAGYTAPPNAEALSSAVLRVLGHKSDFLRLENGKLRASSIRVDTVATKYFSAIKDVISER